MSGVVHLLPFLGFGATLVFVLLHNGEVGCFEDWLDRFTVRDAAVGFVTTNVLAMSIVVLTVPNSRRPWFCVVFATLSYNRRHHGRIAAACMVMLPFAAYPSRQHPNLADIFSVKLWSTGGIFQRWLDGACSIPQV